MPRRDLVGSVVGIIARHGVGVVAPRIKVGAEDIGGANLGNAASEATRRGL